jgi:hypothetical protein
VTDEDDLVPLEDKFAILEDPVAPVLMPDDPAGAQAHGARVPPLLKRQTAHHATSKRV